jgi:hypothetical protein
MAGTVYVENERTSLIFGKKVEQLYRFTVEAEAGDFMGLWYEASSSSEFYGDRSATITFEIKDTAPRATPPDAGTSEGGPP